MTETEEKIVIREEFLDQAVRLARGAEVLPGGVNELAMKLQKAHDENRPLRIKLGMDPSRPDLHLGHTVVMRKIKQFQEMGHKVVLLVGGATAMIGDPSGKSDTRPSLSKEEVEVNSKTYFDQMSKVVDISKSEVVNNADWLHKLNLLDIIQLSSKVTVAQIMARDDFAKRYAEGRPISIHEFFYPLMQAYDSVAIDADIELGGTDQRFNVLLGREIQYAYGKKDPQMVILLPLLEGTDGEKKMSKSYPEHCISLTDDAKNMYGKLMSIPDELIAKYYALLTDISNSDLRIVEENLKTQNPRDIKMKLAHLITSMYHDDVAADNAQNEFVNVVQNKGIPEDIPEIKLTQDIPLLDFISDNNLAPSRGEAKRLFASNAIKLDGEKCTDVKHVLTLDKLPVVVQVGKRKYMKAVQ
ncbi:MAG: tyrosine--tRNA ligase [Candidatus Gastranaerophilales bacterium]|nr:tyrosine--tRNA ligase [Candidatus Gastranaerophilales bacterium]